MVPTEDLLVHCYTLIDDLIRETRWGFAEFMLS